MEKEIPINNVVAGQNDSHTGGIDPVEEISGTEKTGPDEEEKNQATEVKSK